MQALDVKDETDKTVTGVSDAYRTFGHTEFGLQSVAKTPGASPSGVVILQGSNTGGSDDAEWVDLSAGVTHTAAGTKHEKLTGVPYKFVRVKYTLTDITLDAWYLHGVGNTGNF